MVNQPCTPTSVSTLRPSSTIAWLSDAELRKAFWLRRAGANPKITAQARWHRRDAGLFCLQVRDTRHFRPARQLAFDQSGKLRTGSASGVQPERGKAVAHVSRAKRHPQIPLKLLHHAVRC